MIAAAMPDVPSNNQLSCYRYRYIEMKALKPCRLDDVDSTDNPPDDDDESLLAWDKQTNSTEHSLVSTNTPTFHAALIISS